MSARVRVCDRGGAVAVVVAAVGGHTETYWLVVPLTQSRERKSKEKTEKSSTSSLNGGG